MSEFSDMCKKIIQENGTTVYRLSIETGLERTALQRMVNGQRIPNEEFIHRFIKALRIPHKDEHQLLELYKCESTGETTYYNRRYIRTIINNLILDANSDELPESNRLNDNVDNLLPPKLEGVLNEVLTAAFQNGEKDCIRTNYPINNASFVRNVLRLAKKYPDKMEIKHVFSLKIKPEDVLHNLKVLNYMLPLANSNYLEYKGYFQYVRMDNDEKELLMLFPYYIMTNNCVLAFNNSLSEYLLLNSPDIILQYHLEWNKISGGLRLLIESTSSNEEAWMKYNICVDNNDENRVMIESQPCLYDMMSDTTFLSILKNRAPLLYDFGKMMVDDNVYELADGICLFSKSGMIKFCDTGNFEGQIGAVLPSLDLSERKQALQYLLDKHSSKKHKLLLMKDEWLYPKNLYFEITGNYRVNIVNMTDMENIKFFKVDDTNIGRAFADFATALVESECVCTEEETEQFLISILMKLP